MLWTFANFSGVTTLKHPPTPSPSKMMTLQCWGSRWSFLWTCGKQTHMSVRVCWLLACIRLFHMWIVLLERELARTLNQIWLWFTPRREAWPVDWNFLSSRPSWTNFQMIPSLCLSSSLLHHQKIQGLWRPSLLQNFMASNLDLFCLRWRFLSTQSLIHLTLRWNQKQRLWNLKWQQDQWWFKPVKAITLTTKRWH